ncbi:MAG: DUF1634 domain-containing protein [Candidatus Binataceae bacterium]
MNLPKIGDRDIERMVSILLRTGVIVAGAVVLGGGVFYLLRHGVEAANHHTFYGQPAMDRVITQIFAGALALRARSIIQFGVLVLIATPILRVALALVGFTLERDRTYAIVTLIVLCVLLGSLIAGAVQA